MTTKAPTKIMPREDYYALHGLRVLRDQHKDALTAIEKAMAELLGEEGDVAGYYGHVSDAVWDPQVTVDGLLETYGWEVRKP